jgi:putative copper resistance protein D
VILDAAFVLVRLGVYLDLMVLFGLASFGLHALSRAERRFGATLDFRAWLLAATILGLALSILHLAALAAGMAGVPIASVDRASINAVLWGMGVGAAWLVRMAALITALLFLSLGRRRPSIALCGVAGAGAVALGSLAWVGHGAMDEGAVGWGHLAADIVHLLAAGIWLGALLALVLLVMRRAGHVDPNHLDLSLRALAGFSTTGSLAVGAIIVSGIVNLWLVVGPANILALPGSLYGRLMIAKLALFVAMLGLAAANRFRLVPAFEAGIAARDHRRALGTLRCGLAVEAGCGVAIVMLVAWLGTLEPWTAM